MKIKLLLSYIVSLALIFAMLWHQKESKIDQYLLKHTQDYKLLYDTHYHQYKVKAKILFDTMVNTPEVITIYKKLQIAESEQKDILRKELFSKLAKKYEQLKHIRLKQLHFHLSNNESFLRFHKSENFGDNLTGVRSTIEYVNKHKKEIDSFEEGRIYSGYRFVFPLSDELSNHLGSVEVSFDMSIFTSEFMQHYKVLSNFHLKASIVEQKVWKENIDKAYMKSTFDGYYMQRNIMEEIERITSKSYEQLKPDQKVIDEIAKIIESETIDTVYFASLHKIITIIPIRNKVDGKRVAFVTVRGDGVYIRDVIRSFYIDMLLIFVFASIIYFLIRRESVLQEQRREILERRVQEEVQKNREKDLELLRQHKLVNMSEMISNIAHQWRQPLSNISVNAGTLQLRQELESLSKEDLYESLDKIVSSTQYLSEVIDTFSGFMKENQGIQKLSLQKEISKTLEIISATLEYNKIEINFVTQTHRELHVQIHQGELSQVLISLLNNAKDVLIAKEIAQPWIKVCIEDMESFARISIEDNGGGIDEEIIDKIFDPYFTTKHKALGTGLGLSISYKIIVESMQGRLYVQNGENGAKFFIELALS